MLDPDISARDALRHLHVPDDDAPEAVGRRQFLRLLGMGVGAGLAGGVFGSSLLDPLLAGHDPSAWAQGPIGAHDGVLVLVGLYGGNDGLNTSVPITDGNYYSQRGSLAISPQRALPVNASTGLHPQLTKLQQFWNSGQLAIVEGVGYANPDFSHFNSLGYWMGGRPNTRSSTGWLGRWLDGYLAGRRDLFAAAHVGSSLPLTLIGAASRGTTVPAATPKFGADATLADRHVSNALRAMRTTTAGTWQNLVSGAIVDALDVGKTLAPKVPSAGMATGPLSTQMEVAARLINANIGFRVVTTGFHDFDQHADLPNEHSARMAELNAGITRFFQVLDPSWASRVTVATFSEFGRTSWANQSLGTDHGSAAPQLVFGRNVKGGIYGQRPSLAGLSRWARMGHHVDFRSYYASLLDGWMGGGSSTVLGGTFADLGLFRTGPGNA
ncbi:MAG: DUF1501 domain-containing protein [Ilumatobacteraceae bacterium]